MTEFNFSKDELLHNIWLGGRVFLIEMPARKNDANAIHTFEDDEEFTKLIFADKKFNVIEVGRLQVNGIISITFGLSDLSDEEIITFIAECASKCTFS